MADHFPLEILFDKILFDIFSRLPIKSLLRFKCVSKKWCNIIDDPFLANMHLIQCAHQDPKILLVDHSNPTQKPDVMFEEDGDFFFKASFKKMYFLENSCNGLLCFAKPCDAVVLFNPLRKQLLPLPPSGVQSSKRKYGLGFDISTNTYKIVCVFFRDQEGSADQNPIYNLGAQVFTLGTGSWRSISKGPPCPLLGRPVFACGALHWIVNPNGDDLEGKIVSFHIGKEEFTLISPPKICLYYHLVDVGGHLGFVDVSSNSHIEIWVMKEYGKKEWVEEYKVDIKAPDDGVSDNTLIKVIGLWGLGEILLKYCESFFSYNPKTDTLRYIHIPGVNHDIEVFRGSLRSLSRFKAE